MTLSRFYRCPNRLSLPICDVRNWQHPNEAKTELNL